MKDELATSDGLLTTILELLQNLSANVEEFGPKLEAIETEIQEIHTRINTVIEEGFPSGNLKRHRQWHQSRRGFLARLFNI